MLLMVLDHARSFFHVDAPVVPPTAISSTTPAVFFTRWITHFCAPVFVMLAGASASLGGSRGQSRADIASFLRRRGLLLIALEFTLVQFGFTFNFTYHDVVAQVLWAIGCGMIILSFCLPLSYEAAMAAGLAIIASHNGLDALHGAIMGTDGIAWAILFSNTTMPVGPHVLLHPKYPVVPWAGVMILGYGLGGILSKPPATRQKQLFILGAAFCLGFLVLRAVNGYGDPGPWSANTTAIRTFMSFLNTEKYPPSLHFLMMTLGPALLALAWIDRRPDRLWAPVLLFGRAPLFYYVSHIFVLHALLVVADQIRELPPILHRYPVREWGYGMPIVYAAWVITVIALYPVCRTIADLKRRRPDLTFLRYF